MSETDPPDDEMEMLAVEYVLGLLTVAQLPQVAASRQGSARFDLAVRQWELRLLPMAEALEPVQPDPRVWSAIAGAIRPTAPARAGIWRSLNFWRGFSLAAGALCAALIVAVLLRPPPVAPAVIANAVLASHAQGIFVATVEATSTGTRLLISPTQVTIPAGRSAELWLIAPGQKPAPLGLLASARATSFTLPAAAPGVDLRLSKLAVSLEPPGGSPTGQPTGPIIAAAAFQPL